MKHRTFESILAKKGDFNDKKVLLIIDNVGNSMDMGDFKNFIRELLEANQGLKIVIDVKVKLEAKMVVLNPLKDQHVLGLLCNRAKRTIT